MAALTGAQLAVDLRIEAMSVEARLGQSLAPLVLELEAQTSPKSAGEVVARFHAAFIRQGWPRHLIEIMDADGGSLATAGDVAVRDEREVLSVTRSLSAAAFGSSPVVLRIAEIDPQHFAERTRRWRDWAIHLVTTAALLQLLLYLVVRHQIAAPIERLVAGVRRMQMGYWSDLADPGGAWELRWLGSRFRAFGQDLGRNVLHFVAAQRRAFAQQAARPGGADVRPMAMEAVSQPHPSPAVEPDAVLARLEGTATKLRSGSPAEPSIRALARSAWDHFAPQAEELGYPELRQELEDAALRILAPADWQLVDSRVEAERPRLEALANEYSRAIREAVESHGLACVAVERRVKHSAGVWRKMQHKGLDLNQIHDLIAVRIIVATEADCYLALQAVQDLFSPIVGRFKDYVATPKANGYRGLHLSVLDHQGQVFEVQIRSVAMHRHAEQGPAAHVLYKDESVVEPGRSRREVMADAVRAAIRRWASLRSPSDGGVAPP